MSFQTVVCDNVRTNTSAFFYQNNPHSDTYLSLRYICYNYRGPVYIKQNFEALGVLRQCEPPSVFASGRNQVIHVTFQSYQLIIM